MISPNAYQKIFDICTRTSQGSKIRLLDYVCKVAIAHQGIYGCVEKLSGVPWMLIATIHYRESDQNFTRHLHNGDPLSARTVRVPVGRPLKKNPPFTWTESAIDALSDRWKPKTWDLPGCLEFLERYNGMGYHHKGLLSPYLWSFTDQYVKGLYVSDGRLDPEKIDSRPGCVALIKTFMLKGIPLGALPVCSESLPFH